MVRENTLLDGTLTSGSAEGANSRAFHAGAKIGGYTLIRELGHGGMGWVWEASHDQLGKKVAIKTLRSELAEDENIVARFIQEGRACVKLRHPNAVDVSDVGAENGVPYLVMDYLEGQTLTSYLASGKLNDAKSIANVAVPILCALQAAHDEGIVHRDVKPGNVFMTRARDGEIIPTLLDFGISKVVGDEGFAVRSNSLLATPVYMSPEQARDSSQVDSRTDIYSLGVLMYQALTGRKPFQGTNMHELANAICTAQYTDIALACPDLPEELIAIVRKAMALDVRDRYQTAGTMARELIHFAGTRVRVLHAMELGLGGATRAIENPAAEPVADAPTRPLEALKATPIAVMHNPPLEPRTGAVNWRTAAWALALVGLLIATWFGSRALMTEAAPSTTPPVNAARELPAPDVATTPTPAPVAPTAVTAPPAEIPRAIPPSVPSSQRRNKAPRRTTGGPAHPPANIFEVE